MPATVARGAFIGLVVLGGLALGSPLPGASAPAAVQAFGQEQAPVDLLLVVEVRTFQGLILTEVLARALQATGLFSVEPKFVEVSSSFDDPLGPNPDRSRQYDIVLVVPLGLEDGSLRQLWIASRPPGPKTRPEVVRGVQLIKELVQRGSQGRVEAVGVTDDLAPALLAAVFLRNGWLR